MELQKPNVQVPSIGREIPESSNRTYSTDRLNSRDENGGNGSERDREAWIEREHQRRHLERMQKR